MFGNYPKTQLLDGSLKLAAFLTFSLPRLQSKLDRHARSASFPGKILTKSWLTGIASLQDLIGWKKRREMNKWSSTVSRCKRS